MLVYILAMAKQTVQLPIVRKPRLILLWAYFRGGSSFAGGLLSANQNTAFLYEPLHVYRKDPDVVEARQLLKDLFSCKAEALSRVGSRFRTHFNPLTKRKPRVDKCLQSQTIVAKVNRLFVPTGSRWLLENPDIKVCSLRST